MFSVALCSPFTVHRSVPDVYRCIVVPLRNIDVILLVYPTVSDDSTACVATVDGHGETISSKAVANARPSFVTRLT